MRSILFPVLLSVFLMKYNNNNVMKMKMENRVRCKQVKIFLVSRIAGSYKYKLRLSHHPRDYSLVIEFKRWKCIRNSDISSESQTGFQNSPYSMEYMRSLLSEGLILQSSTFACERAYFISTYNGNPDETLLAQSKQCGNTSFKNKSIARFAHKGRVKCPIQAHKGLCY